VHVWAYNFVCDDTFITLRYARNLADGHGLVFNLTERVEGFSSPLWTILLAGLRVLGSDPLFAARLLGIVAGLVTLILTYRLGLAASLSPFASLLAPTVLAANGSFACWAASGMEAPVYVCLIVASFLFVYTGSLLGGILSTVALIFVRPEAVVPFLLLTVAQFLLNPAGRGKCMRIWFGACGIGFLVLFMSRFLYFGDWLPNTYYTKVGGGLHSIARGLNYLGDYAGDHEGLVLLCLPVVYGLLVNSVRVRFLALGVLCLWFTTVVEGGDGQPMYRFALSALPLLAVLDARLVADVCRVAAPHFASRLRLRLAIGVLVLLWLTVHVTTPMIGTYYDRYKYHKDVEVPQWTAVGKWLKENAREGESLAAVPIGAVSYYSELTAVDMMGLTDEHIGHRRMPHMGEGWAGHEKHDGQYVLGRRPTYLLAGNIDVTDQPRDPGQVPFIPYYGRAVWERERDLYESDRIAVMYRPRSVLIAPRKYLNFYELREEYRGSAGVGGVGTSKTQGKPAR
jgi:hypothetical protein